MLSSECKREIEVWVPEGVLASVMKPLGQEAHCLSQTHLLPF